MNNNSDFYVPMIEEENVLDTPIPSRVTQQIEEPKQVDAAVPPVQVEEANIPVAKKVEGKKQYRHLLRTPYRTKGLTTRRIFDTTQSLPGTTELLTNLENVLQSLIHEIKRKGVRTSGSLQERLLHDELQTIEGNCHKGEENFAQYFENNPETSQYLIGKDGIELGIAKAIANPSKLGTELSDDKATAHISNASEVSVPAKIHCFNSGILLIMSPFTVTDISRLTSLIVMANDTIGRATAGAALTGDDVHLYHQIADTLLQKVTHTNVKELNTNKYDIYKIKDVLEITDLVYLLAGGLAGMYPRGYPIFHPCASPDCDYNIAPEQDGERNYKPDSLLDFNLITHTRNELFDNEDFEHWAKPIVTLEDISKYKLRLSKKLELIYPSRHLFLTTETDIGSIKHYVNFKIPTLNEYFTEAKKWCAAIETFISQTVDQNRQDWVDDKAHQTLRLNRSEKFAMDTALGKYIHFINYLETITNDDPNTRKVINDRNSILTQLLDVYSADADALINITDLAKKVKENYAVGWTGIPNFECPVCHYGQTKNEDDNNKLIPLNLLNFFFTVMSWKYLN